MAKMRQDAIGPSSVIERNWRLQNIPDDQLRPRKQVCALLSQLPQRRYRIITYTAKYMQCDIRSLDTHVPSEVSTEADL